MKLDLIIGSWHFNFLSYSPQRIEVPNVCIIDLYKWHDHRYSCNAFFYGSKRIISSLECNSKYKMYCAVQNLLQEFL